MSAIILVTTDYREAKPYQPNLRDRSSVPKVLISTSYLDSISAAGGTPLLIPPGTWDVDQLLSIVDGVVLSGGDFDVHPHWYGGTADDRLYRTIEARTALDIELVQGALKRKIPILGVCGGMQVMAVATGGSLIMDLPQPSPTAISHEQPTSPEKAWHSVSLTGHMATILGTEVMVNSTHHQAIDNPGVFTVEGVAPDGVPEAISLADSFAIGVQWHPEIIGDLRPYEALIKAALDRRQQGDVSE